MTSTDPGTGPVGPRPDPAQPVPAPPAAAPDPWTPPQQPGPWGPPQQPGAWARRRRMPGRRNPAPGP